MLHRPSESTKDAKLLLLLCSCGLLTLACHITCIAESTYQKRYCTQSKSQTVKMHCMQGVGRSRTLAALKLQSELKQRGPVPLQPSMHLSQCYSL